MGSGAPLLDEYKQDFFLKRLPQTILGGPKFNLGYQAPCYVYSGQVLVFIIPWILGGIFTVLVERSALTFDVGSFVYGSLICVFVFSCQILSNIMHNRQLEPVFKKKTASFLNDEDEVDFMSCCGSETISFIITPKKYKLNILLHAALSGVMCGVGLWYLLPQTLNSLFNSTGATVVLYILGWLTLCISQYPLTTCAPPELATFRALDTYELSPLLRPFYVMVCLSFFILSTYIAGFTLADQILHIVFVCLPLIWFLGILPPLDALLFWGLEQFLTVFLGGSPTSSNVWTVIMVLLSTGSFLAMYFIPVCTASVVVSAGLGYILSTDIGGCVRELFKTCGKRNKVSSSQTFTASNQQTTSVFRWIVCFLYHFILTGITVTLSVCLLLYKSSIPTDSWIVIGYIVIGILVLEKILRESLGVYVCFGLWRNKLYPDSAYRKLLFRRGGRGFHIYSKLIGFLRRFIINLVAPLVMLSYLCVMVPASISSSCYSNLTISSSVWLAFAINRAFRWVWQSSVHSLLEISVVHIIMLTLPSDPIVTSLGVFKLLLLISFVRDRLSQVLSKLWFVMALLITSWTDEKQRRKSTIGIILTNILLFPLVLVVVVVSAVFSAPLLVLFTLPVFLIAFPRPLKSWPNAVGASANGCADTVFYRQLSQNLSTAMKTAFANGSLGEPHPGNHYLVRFQDRLIWVMVLERGASYCTLSIKGLELQETSCHTIEASRVDDIFDSTFESEAGFGLCSFNSYPLHTLTPCDAVPVQTYSDARNVLTGIIDSPENQQFIFEAFPKVLTWMLLTEVCRINKKSSTGTSVDEEKNKVKLKNSSSKESWGNNNNKASPVPHKDTVVTIGASSIIRGDTCSPVVQELDDFDDWADSRPNSALSVKPKRKPSWNTSFQSFTSILSNEEEQIEMNKLETVKKKPSRVNVRKSSDSIEELGFGLPVIDLKTKPKPHRLPFQVSGKTGNSICRPVTKLAGPTEFTCPQSHSLRMPDQWRELPVEESRVQKLAQEFPSDWYRFVLHNLGIHSSKENTKETAVELVKDDVLYTVYSQLTMVCCQVFDPIGGAGYGSGASRLYKCYRGDVPSNAVYDWLMEDKRLFNFVLQAYRYSFKLMFDQCVLGEINDHNELLEYLEDYHADWYIGLDTEPDWNSAVLNSKHSLFSLGHTSHQGTYSSRTVTLQDTVVQIGRLNGEAVRGQWANLSLELLYLTNDDEERYSIQAHPALLRNLTVQSADPPLGYPIYSSEPTSISLL